jgi:formylmethanofuran--tetrahydromethanopterin N-formyltransferase
MVEIEDTYCEAFDGLYARILITAKNEELLRKAACGATALPSTVFGKSEGGIEKLLSEGETPDGRSGAIIQIWVNYGKRSRTILEEELGWRIRQGILVVPTTAVFNTLDSDEKIDMMAKVGHCGDGYEHVEEYLGLEVITIPIMMPDFRIERHLGCKRGIAGGNIWLLCTNENVALIAGERALKAISKVEGVITPFDLCSAGSKPETKYLEIGPTTNHLYCPSLRDKIKDSRVPEGVKSIPEIVINGVSIDAVKEAMRNAILSIKNMEGVVKVSAGNYGGKLGKYHIFLRELV